MPTSKDESFELPPVQFIRGSKMRKSFRIRHRSNSKLPPAAILYMKLLENSKNRKEEYQSCSKKSDSVFYLQAEDSEFLSEVLKAQTALSQQRAEMLRETENSTSPEDSLNESFDPLADEEEPLIKKTPVLRRRKSIKKLSREQNFKLDAIMNFFRKF